MVAVMPMPPCRRTRFGIVDCRADTFFLPHDKAATCAFAEAAAMQRVVVTPSPSLPPPPSCRAGRRALQGGRFPRLMKIVTCTCAEAVGVERVVVTPSPPPLPASPRRHVGRGAVDYRVGASDAASWLGASPRRTAPKCA